LGARARFWGGGTRHGYAGNRVLSRQGKHVEAEQMHRQTLELRTKVLGLEHPYTLTSMSQLARVLSRQGKYVEAEQMH
jgi:hypothetical protein